MFPTETGRSACPRHGPPSRVCMCAPSGLTHSCPSAQLSPLLRRERGEQGKQAGRERGQDCWTPALPHRSAGTLTRSRSRTLNRISSLSVRECPRRPCLDHAAGHFGTVRPARFGCFFGTRLGKGSTTVGPPPPRAPPPPRWAPAAVSSRTLTHINELLEAPDGWSEVPGGVGG